MSNNYEEVVARWYCQLRPKYISYLIGRYPSMRLEKAENLYQDTFVAVHENIALGRVKANTAWSTYIIQIGLNMANNFMRRTRSLFRTAAGKVYGSLTYYMHLLLKTDASFERWAQCFATAHYRRYRVFQLVQHPTITEYR